MIVEDDVDIATLLETIVREREVDVKTWGSDFSKLFDYAPWRGVDTALVDMMLVGVRGLEILDWLREHVPSVRRLATSASPLHLQEAEAHGHAVIAKPFRVDELLERLR